MILKPPKLTQSFTQHHNTNLKGGRSKIGSYQIVQKLGEGGQGDVYKGRHELEVKAEQQGGSVAIKILTNTDASDHLFTEAETGLALDHPNIVKVFDLIREGEQIALIQEFVPGKHLGDLYDERGEKFTWAVLEEYIKQICYGLHYAHSKGVVHRDIKPDNIMITPNNKAVILDFGIAKKQQKQSKKTQVGVAMGTVNYMAPEQYQSATNVDGRADIYALAMMTFEMLSGFFPWSSEVSDWNIMSVS